MGIFDEYRDGISTISLAGNRAAAAQYIPQARKFAEVLKGKLDLGVNLGMDYKDTLALDEFTTMNVRLSPGVTNETVHIEITSTPPIPAPARPGIEIDITANCPRLPLSRPGARMFTQLFGHDVFERGGLRRDIFLQTAAVKTQTPYISPTLDQGSYCSTGPFPGNGDLLFHDEVRLAQPFRLMGRDVTTCYLHSRWLGIVSPNVFLSFQPSAIPLGMPCDCDFPGSPTFTPNPESLGPGNNFAIHMDKNAGQFSCYQGGFFRQEGVDSGVFLIQGNAQIEQELFEGKITGSEDEGLRRERREGQAEQRQFAAINWTVPGAEAEIVLLYASQRCPPAVGFFYGGPDGIQASAFVGLVTSLLCDLTPQCFRGETPTVPLAYGGFFTGANRRALAYTGCSQSSAATGSDTSEDNIQGRSFWFELNAEGLPNGQGLHNGPLLDPSIGSGDLDFR